MSIDNRWNDARIIWLCVAENIANRQAPAMSWDDTLGNMRLLDRWRAEIGLVYEQDKV